MARLKIIGDLWSSYEREVLIPVGAPAIQVQETRRAFYAGAAGLLSAIVNILDEGSEPTDQDLRVMDAIHQELEEFNVSVIAERN